VIRPTFARRPPVQNFVQIRPLAACRLVDRPTGQTARQIFTRDDSDDAASRSIKTFRKAKFEVNIFTPEKSLKVKNWAISGQIFGQKRFFMKISFINGS